MKLQNIEVEVYAKRTVREDHDVLEAQEERWRRLVNRQYDRRSLQGREVVQLLHDLGDPCTEGARTSQGSFSAMLKPIFFNQVLVGMMNSHWKLLTRSTLHNTLEGVFWRFAKISWNFRNRVNYSFLNIQFTISFASWLLMEKRTRSTFCNESETWRW